MIKIIEERTYQARHANIIISDGIDHYYLGVGGLPLEGDLQPILDARETNLWQVALVKGTALITEEVRAILYNSPLAGGWSEDEFQEAFNENFGGAATKLQRIRALRDAIRDEWPY